MIIVDGRTIEFREESLYVLNLMEPRHGRFSAHAFADAEKPTFQDESSPCPTRKRK